MFKFRFGLVFSAILILVLTGCTVATPAPTATALPTATYTSLPPTNTSTASATATSTDTVTPVPPTSTATATNTPIPPTATFTNTPRPVPTRTAPVTAVQATAAAPTATAPASASNAPEIAGIVVESNSSRTMVVDVALIGLIPNATYNIVAYADTHENCTPNCKAWGKAQSGVLHIFRAGTSAGVITLKVEIDNLLCGSGGQFTTDKLTVRLSAFVPDDNPGALATFPATNDWCGA